MPRPASHPPPGRPSEPHPSAGDVVALYERTAAAWAARRGATVALEGAWLARFAAELPPGATVLDVGCGTGVPIAGALLARGLRVTGVDAAPAMIARARRALPPGPGCAARWLVGDVRTLALGERFDGVLAWHSLFHLSPADQRRAFAVLAAHAAPGAALLFTSGAQAGEAIGTWAGAPLYHASLDPDEYRALLAAHGFGVLAHVAEDPACGGATVWLARRPPARRADG